MAKKKYKKSTTKKSSNTKKVSKKVAKAEAKGYKSFRLQKRIKHEFKDDVPTFRFLVKKTWSTIMSHKKDYAKITAVYAALYIFFVRGETQFNVEELDGLLDELIGAESSQWTLTLRLAGQVASTGTQTSGEGGTILGIFLFLISTLALVWMLRNIWADKKFNIKDAFYKGMYPLVPTLLIMLVIFLQLIPAGIGSGIMEAVQSGGIAITGSEQTIFVVIFLLLVLLSGYLITSSIMALYIVTIPDMYPWEALKNAKYIVQHRRWQIFSKIVYGLLLYAVIAMLILLIFLATLSQFSVFVVGLLAVSAVPVAHTYLYTLYRGLI